MLLQAHGRINCCYSKENGSLCTDEHNSLLICFEAETAKCNVSKPENWSLPGALGSSRASDSKTKAMLTLPRREATVRAARRALPVALGVGLHHHSNSISDSINCHHHG